MATHEMNITLQEIIDSVAEAMRGCYAVPSYAFSGDQFAQRTMPDLYAEDVTSARRSAGMRLGMAAKKGLLKRQKVGHTWYYWRPEDER